jgi:hypothetical protein
MFRRGYTRDMKILGKQILSATLCLSLLANVCDFSWALPSGNSTPAFLIPASLGSITERFQAGPSSKQVILIQDLHAHYQVQKNIAGILTVLAKKLSTGGQGKTPPFSLAVEGASGPIDSSVLALFPDPRIKKAAADYLMQEGELTGAEYYAVMQGLPHLLVGVENGKYYELHRDLFRRTLPDRTQMVSVLKGVQQDLVLVKNRVYSKELKRLQHRLDGYTSGRVSAFRMLSWLKEEASPYGIEITGWKVADIETAAFLVKAQMADTPAERDVVQVEQDLALLQKVQELSATEADVRSLGPRFNQFVALFHSLAIANGLSSFNESRVRDLLTSSIDYYALALMRNKPMVDNTLNLIPGASGQAVLVAGGFHTRLLTQLLRERHVSYVVITPDVKEINPAYHDLYLKRLNGDLLTPEEVMKSAPERIRQSLSLTHRLSGIWPIRLNEANLAVGTFLDQKPVRQAALAALRVATSVLDRVKQNYSLRRFTARAMKFAHGLALSSFLLMTPQMFSGQMAPAYATIDDQGDLSALTQNQANEDDSLQNAAAFSGTEDERAASHRRVQSQADLQARIDYRKPAPYVFVKAPVLGYRIATDKVEDLPAVINHQLGTVDQTQYAAGYLSDKVNSIVVLQMNGDKPDFYPIGQSAFQKYREVSVAEVEEENPDLIKGLERVEGMGQLLQSHDPKLIGAQKTVEVPMIRMTEIDYPKEEEVTLESPGMIQTKPAGKEGYLGKEADHYYLVNTDAKENPIGYVPAPQNRKSERGYINPDLAPGLWLLGIFLVTVVASFFGAVPMGIVLMASTLAFLVDVLVDLYQTRDSASEKILQEGNHPFPDERSEFRHAHQKGGAVENVMLSLFGLVFAGTGSVLLRSALASGVALTTGAMASIAVAFIMAAALIGSGIAGHFNDREELKAVGDYIAKQPPYERIFMANSYRISRGGPFQSRKVQSFMGQIRMSEAERRVVQTLFYEPDGTSVSAEELDLIDESLRLVRLDRDKRVLDKLTAEQILREVQKILHSASMDRSREASKLMYSQRSEPVPGAPDEYLKRSKLYSTTRELTVGELVNHYKVGVWPAIKGVAGVTMNVVLYHLRKDRLENEVRNLQGTFDLLFPNQEDHITIEILDLPWYKLLWHFGEADTEGRVIRINPLLTYGMKLAVAVHEPIHIQHPDWSESQVLGMQDHLMAKRAEQLETYPQMMIQVESAKEAVRSQAKVSDLHSMLGRLMSDLRFKPKEAASISQLLAQSQAALLGAA